MPEIRQADISFFLFYYYYFFFFKGIQVKCDETPNKLTQSATAPSGTMKQGSSLHSLSVDFGDTSGTFGTSDLDLSTSDMTPRAQKKADSTKPRGAKVKRDKQTQLAIKWANLSADKQVAVAGTSWLCCCLCYLFVRLFLLGFCCGGGVYRYGMCVEMVVRLSPLNLHNHLVP